MQYFCSFHEKDHYKSQKTAKNIGLDIFTFLVLVVNDQRNTFHWSVLGNVGKEKSKNFVLKQKLSPV